VRRQRRRRSILSEMYAAVIEMSLREEW
jgi:FtsZ-interacting cell division protein YlmF